MKPPFDKCIEMLRSDVGMVYEDGYQGLQGYLESHLDQLINLTNSENEPIMRSRLVELLGDSLNPVVIPHLKTQLNDVHEEVRMWAYLSLDGFETPEAKLLTEEFRKSHPNEDYL